MARNPVQFQKGMSRAAFQERYSREDQCHEELVRLRWPDGFACPACLGRKYSFYAARRAFQCSLCRRQTSVKAGTLFHKSKLPLGTWFLAIYLVTQSKNDISALELSRQLGLTYDTAWIVKQKLMAAMGERNKAYKLKGSVQIDDAYLGGERKGTSGRGAEGKTPFLAAVETRADMFTSEAKSRSMSSSLSACPLVMRRASLMRWRGTALPSSSPSGL